MKQILIMGLFLMFISRECNGQYAPFQGSKYLIKKAIFSCNEKSKDIKYLTVVQKNDSLYFETKENILLGSVAYSDRYIPDSVMKESNIMTKRIITLYSGEKYTCSVTSKNINGIVADITISIDNKEVLNLTNKKSYHCTNHGATVHTCPTSPGIAKPPCNKDCIWEADK